MTNDNYIPRSTKLLRGFDRSLARVKRMLIARLGENKAGTLIRMSREEYRILIPQIPYLGEKNFDLFFLIPAIRYFAIYQTLRRQGWTPEDAGELIREISEAEFKAIPGFVRRVIGYIWFSPWFTGRLKKYAAESKLRKYPGGYVLDYVEGDGRNFDYGIDWTECGFCKFLRAQNAIELAPYVCAADKAASDMMGWGLTRTMTLSEGREKCDFRYKKGGTTNVAPPINQAGRDILTGLCASFVPCPRERKV